MLELSTPPLAVDVPGWYVLVVAAIGMVGSVLAGWLPLWGERLKRKDGLYTYKRETYRSFLDHAYWLERGETHDTKPRREREELYVADWYRILLLGGKKVIEELEDLRRPGSLTDERAKSLIPILKRDLRGKGFGEPS